MMPLLLGPTEGDEELWLWEIGNGWPYHVVNNGANSFSIKHNFDTEYETEMENDIYTVVFDEQLLRDKKKSGEVHIFFQKHDSLGSSFGYVGKTRIHSEKFVEWVSTCIEKHARARWMVMFHEVYPYLLSFPDHFDPQSMFDAHLLQSVWLQEIVGISIQDYWVCLEAYYDEEEISPKARGLSEAIAACILPIQPEGPKDTFYVKLNRTYNGWADKTFELEYIVDFVTEMKKQGVNGLLEWKD